MKVLSYIFVIKLIVRINIFVLWIAYKIPYFPNTLYKVVRERITQIRLNIISKLYSLVVLTVFSFGHKIVIIFIFFLKKE